MSSSRECSGQLSNHKVALGLCRAHVNVLSSLVIIMPTIFSKCRYGTQRQLSNHNFNIASPPSHKHKTPCAGQVLGRQWLRAAWVQGLCAEGRQCQRDGGLPGVLQPGRRGQDCVQRGCWHLTPRNARVSSTSPAGRFHEELHTYTGMQCSCMYVAHSRAVARCLHARSNTNTCLRSGLLPLCVCLCSNTHGHMREH
jgi:hypothetical protein